MNNLVKITALSSALALASCGSDENNQTANDTGDAAPAAKESMMEKAEGAMEKAAEIAEALKLDTSSLDSFKSSLSAMKSSLSGDQTSQLTSALSSLAKDAVKEEKGGLISAAKDLAKGKSMEETLYEKLGDTLDGMTFDDILKLAN